MIVKYVTAGLRRIISLTHSITVDFIYFQLTLRTTQDYTAPRKGHT